MATRVRRDALALKPLVPTDAWDPVFEWYARAILEMQGRPIDNPTSWRYQAAVHGYDRGEDPLAQGGEHLPSTADQRRFWNQCQHASWFFLPWHRLYLGYFEQILRAAIARMRGPDTWALPYWNYSDRANPNARKLPLAFTLPTMPGGGRNPLRVDDRLRGNAHDIVATARQVDVRTCLTDSRFEAPDVGGTAGFGGPRTGFRHQGGLGAPIGKLENTPHGSVHVAVNGFMGSFNTAGLDPIFWLHHANIDRLWAVWHNRNPANRDPQTANWLSAVAFELHDSHGRVVRHTASEVVNTASALFDYRYDNIADPIGGVAAAEPEAGRAPMAPGQPEMIGANESPVVLTGTAVSTSMSVAAPSGPAARLAAGEPPEVHVNIENVKSVDAAATYAVYLNLPEGASADDHQDLFIGLLPMFGVPEASRGDTDRPGDGLTFSLDATDVVRRLEARGQWTGDVRVTFVPEGMPIADARRAAAEPEPVTVGRVSLYYA